MTASEAPGAVGELGHRGAITRLLTIIKEAESLL